MEYPVIRNKPVARFRYKGTHSKNIRREVVITDSRRDVLTGYEVREGNETRTLGDAPIKSFKREKIEGLERLTLRQAGLND